MNSLETVSRWGLLPVALALATVTVLRLAAVTSAGSPGRDDILRGAVLTLAMFVLGVRLLGMTHGLEQDTLFIALFVVTSALVLARRERRLALSGRGFVSRENAPLVTIGALATISAAVATYLLPVWHWDALGYHLPYVNFALSERSLAGVPAGVPYLTTYPHVIERYFIAWRAMLPDDRLVDAAQIPLGLLGAAAIASIGRELGARRDHAFAAGVGWLTLPAVFLQLPTNYIDVGTAALLLTAAAFALGQPNARNVIAAGVALGLLLGSKPNAPIATVLVFGVVAVRGWKAGRRRALVAAAACVALLGLESYLRNMLRYGNPIWPVRLSLGPLSFPGLLPMSSLLESGCAAPRLHGPMALRILRSWTTLDAPPVFDMRYGGLGLLFLAALPAAIVVVVRRRSVALGIVLLAALASPDPAVPRYILAFPGLILALAASVVGRVEPRWRCPLFILAAAAAVFGLLRAYPGLVGEGPPLSEYLSMTERQRLQAVGADGSPRRFYDALARLDPKDVTAFDNSLELPYLAWPPDLSTHAIRVPDDVSSADADHLILDRRVRLLIVDDSSPVAIAARRTEQFQELFRCKPHIPPACLVRDPSSNGQEIPKALYVSTSCVVLFRK
jgi:hypothetical protein